MNTKNLSPTQAFGLAVRTTREKAGISQEKLADLSGLHRTYIGSVERGERNVSLKNILAIAQALSLPTSSLLAATENLLKQEKIKT